MRTLRGFFQVLFTLAMVGAPAVVAADGFRGGFREALGPGFEFSERTRSIITQNKSRAHANDAEGMVRRWNSIAVDASGLDHTPVAAGENRIFGEQLGPGRSSRAMAIVHIAMFDAINALSGGYRSYTSVEATDKQTSMSAAIAQAAHDTLVDAVSLPA